MADNPKLAAAEPSREAVAFGQLQLRLFRTNNRIQKTIDALMKDLGLTVSRWLVLNCIANGPKSVAQIARQYDQTRQGFLWVVESMVKLGQVELHPNPRDRRAKLVHLTAEGHRIYQEAKVLQQEWMERIAKDFTTAELLHISEFMDEIGDVVLIA